MRVLAIDCSTEWLSVAAGDGDGVRAAPRACRPGAFAASRFRWSTPCSPKRGWRSRSRRHRVRRRPRLVHRRAHRLRRRAGTGARRGRCRSCRCPRSKRSRSRRFAAHGATRVVRVPRRADARGLRRRLRARRRGAGASGPRRRCCDPDDVARCRGERLVRRGRWLRRLSRARAARSRCATSTPTLRPERARDRRARAAATRGGRGRRAPRDALPLYVRHRVALDQRRARGGREALMATVPDRLAPLPQRRLAAAASSDDLAYVAALEAQIHAAPWSDGQLPRRARGRLQRARRRARRPHRRVRRA